MRHLCRSLSVSSVLAVSFLCTQPTLHGQTAEKPDLTGFWQLRYDGMNIPKAPLTPAARSASERDKREQQDLHAIRFCNHIGMPAIMDNPTTLDIRQSDAEIAVFPPATSPVRHIYTDGRTPNWDIIDPTTVGYSLGHWEGDKLIVETRDFNAKGVTDIPGGGYRTETSKLFESYKLVESGTALEVTFTWTDPKVFTKPYTYAYRYNRMPPDYRPEEWYCNAADNDRAHFLLDTPTPVEDVNASAGNTHVAPPRTTPVKP